MSHRDENGRLRDELAGVDEQLQKLVDVDEAIAENKLARAIGMVRSLRLDVAHLRLRVERDPPP